MTPHPSAARCITRAADIMNEAGRRAGLPDGAIGWMKTVTLEGTQELMKAREVSVILATGGMGLVRAAYSAGKPAYGVGPGNAPCYIESSADVRKAAERHPDRQVVRQRRAVLVAQFGGRRRGDRRRKRGGSSSTRAATSCRRPRPTRSPKQLVTPQRLPNPAFVGKSADVHRRRRSASRCPPDTRALHRRAERRRPRLPAVDREALPRALLLRRQGLARGLRALQGDPALRRHGSHHVDPLAERRGDPRVRPAQAGLPHLREHADDARLDRPDDRAWTRR